MLIVVTAIVALLQWMTSSKATCPLCHAKALASNRYSKHRTAKKLFGSYRLRVACSVILKKYFRCPSCGEPTAIQIRLTDRRRGKLF